MFGWEKKFRRRKLFDSRYIPLEKRKTRMMIFIILWGIIFTCLIKNFVFSLDMIKGDSMYPGFQKNGYYLVNRFIYNFAEPKRKDVVIIRGISPKEDQMIKRIIGIPGDSIELKDGDVYLSGELLNEPYVEGRTYPNTKRFTVMKDMYFVMGDNRESSYDSRSFGLIRKNNIKGRLSPGKVFTLMRK
ncbi:signal peptidase I [Omnitrophica bacterium]|nr:signal peptidase I [Candidatus Omnitrophota bacterium]